MHYYKFHYNEFKSVNFAITSEQQVCELFLTATPNLFSSYDVFFVHLLPCPLGFTLQHGICDSDSDLREYIDDCMISNQTVRRLLNVYISANLTTRQYIVSTKCPDDYCLPGATGVNLNNSNSPLCQQSRVGVLCSQCAEGYSIVFASNQCRKCSNLHLLYIIYFTFTGLFLIVLLFLLNFTVTSGTINGNFLYVNMVWIIKPVVHLKDRLVTFLNPYFYTVNLGTSFEMCFYNEMLELGYNLHTQFILY